LPRPPNSNSTITPTTIQCHKLKEPIRKSSASTLSRVLPAVVFQTQS
jgi:hypothetical protein